MSPLLKAPAVRRTTLLRVAGVVWLVVGHILMIRGMSNLPGASRSSWLLVGLGMVFGFLKGRLILRHIAKKNIARIIALAPHKDKICIFAFQAMEAYFLVVVMIAMGVGLRYLALPADWLVVIYLTIGSALAIGAYEYLTARRQMI